jgi:cytochrome c2
LHSLFFLAACSLTGAGAARAETPGLLLRFESRAAPDAGADARTARLAALWVAAGAAPTPFLPPGPFRARFEGFLDVELFDEHRFALEGLGRAELEIDGRVVLSADGPELDAAAAAAIDLEPGKRRIALRYESPAAGPASLRLLWASPDFELGPVPPDRLSHDGADESLEAGAQRRRGRELFASRRCHRCHLPRAGFRLAMPEAAEEAPALAGIGARRRGAWLARWIDAPRALRPDATMPRVFAREGSPNGASVERHALDVAAYLAGPSAPSRAGGADPAIAPEQLQRRGREIFESIGCLACHRRPGDAAAAAGDDRIALAALSAGWAPGALAEFLEAPRRHYSASPMPDFGLSPDDARAIAAHLFVLEGGERVIEPAPTGDARRGRELVETSGCLACHAGEGQNRLVAPSLDAIAAGALDAGCLADPLARRGQAPDFEWSPHEREDLRFFFRGGLEALERDDDAEYAERVVRARRCGGCHARDGIADLWSRLSPPASPAEAGAPAAGGLLELRPELTWSGEKLRADWLAALLSEPRVTAQRPWLKARMPAFALDAERAARGLAAQHGRSSAAPEPEAADAALAAGGARLMEREGGLACVTCHAVAGVKAQAVFDAPGSDLAGIGRRLRKDFFHRFLLEPQRYAPGTKMPQFAVDGRSPVPGILDGDARRQFEALWHHLLAKSEP